MTNIGQVQNGAPILLHERDRKAWNVIVAQVGEERARAVRLPPGQKPYPNNIAKALGISLVADTGLKGDEAVQELLSPILNHIARDDLTELVINKPGTLLVETQLGWQVSPAPELTMERLLSLSTAIATYSAQRIDASKPILSAMLPGGERIQIVIPPAVAPGTISISIRKPSYDNRSMESYADSGLFEDVRWQEPQSWQSEKLGPREVNLIRLLKDKNFCTFFETAVAEHLNVCIVGDTGSGKTTFMKALTKFIPGHERIITIEDVRELFIDHPNCVHLLYSKGGQGMGQVTPADLIASCMRMKPDRVLLAELRGAESYDFLKLLTTGHSGSLTSYHAAGCGEAISRFVLMAKEHQEAAAYQDSALKRLLFTTIDVVAHLSAVPVFDAESKQTGKKRRMTEIYFDPVKKSGLAYETA